MLRPYFTSHIAERYHSKMASETRQSRFHRLLVEKPLLLLSVIFALGFAAVLWHATRLSTSLVESSALSNASRFSKVLAEFRSLYTSEVVDRVQGHAVEITHDYHDKAGAIPLPATLSMLLGEKIGTHGKGMEVHLYSPHPFPWRQNTGGLTDDFREEAWRHLSAKPGLPFFRFEEVPQPIIVALCHRRFDAHRVCQLSQYTSRHPKERLAKR